AAIRRKPHHPWCGVYSRALKDLKQRVRLDLKKRKPVIVYLLTLITMSLYFFFWMFQLMSELNTLSRKRVFNIKRKVIVIFSILIPYILIFILLGNPAVIKTLYFFILFLLGFALVILWLIIIIRNLIQISNQISIIEADNSIENRISKDKTILLFFLYFTVIFYIQSHMNTIIDCSLNNEMTLEN
ncbi:hypothetical protein RBH29_17550, partial [Herbivorax sp. ANBcel31]|uniref:hypothetical protein n=1 Tax=Herbivorax sp. ANBcel31 TaxID=3069754 RepID=UPI0027B4611E